MSDRDNRNVFLAGVSGTMEENARRIRMDLEHRGIEVLSTEGKAWPDTKMLIDQYLKQSLLAVHLLGNSGSSAGEQFSTAVLGSLETALDYSIANPQFPIFVWCGSDDRSSSSLDYVQNQLLAKRDREVGPNTEIVQSSLEDFKSLVYDFISTRSAAQHATDRRSSETATPVVAGTGSVPELYVIYDQQDKETAKPITEFIQGTGVTVLESVFEGEQSALRNIHNDYLRRCDAALIIYGKVREPWVRMKQQDLLRAPALGRRKNLAAKGVLLCSSMTDIKSRFSAPDMMVIKDADAAESGSRSNLAGLAPFLKMLSAA